MTCLATRQFKWVSEVGTAESDFELIVWCPKCKAQFRCPVSHDFVYLIPIPIVVGILTDEFNTTLAGYKSDCDHGSELILQMAKMLQLSLTEIREAAKNAQCN